MKPEPSADAEAVAGRQRGIGQREARGAVEDGRVADPTIVSRGRAAVLAGGGAGVAGGRGVGIGDVGELVRGRGGRRGAQRLIQVQAGRRRLIAQLSYLFIGKRPPDDDHLIQPAGKVVAEFPAERGF
jgi:hypothetical protein